MESAQNEEQKTNVTDTETTAKEKTSHKPSTPNNPTVNCKTVEDYRAYMNGNQDDNTNQAHNPVPVDAMTLSELGKKTKAEIREIYDSVITRNNKSDIRIMYTLGYGFTWNQLKTVGEFLGFDRDAESKNSNLTATAAVKKSINGSSTNPKNDDGVVIVMPGKRKTSIKKLTLSDATCRMMDELLQNPDGENKLSNMERSKIHDAIIGKAYEKMKMAKEEGRFRVEFVPTKPMQITWTGKGKDDTAKDSG